MKIKGRTICHICTALSITVLIVCSILRWLDIMHCDQADIIAVSGEIRAFAIPIDINMSLDKRKENKCVEQS